MKKLILVLLILLPLVAQSQWTVSGSNIYNNNIGNVGVGTTSPTFKFHVNSTTSDGLISLFEKNYGGERVLLGVYGYLPTYTANTYLKNSVMLYASGVNTQHFNIVNAQPNGTIRFLTGGYDSQVYERVRIDGTGKVGINKTNPVYQLDVNGIVNATGLYVNGVPFSGGGGSSQWTTTGSNIYFNTGNVAIGTTTISSTTKFEVVGPGSGNGATISASGGGDVLLNSGGSLFFDGNYSYGSGNYIRPVAANTQAFFTSGSERMRIASNGNIGIGTTLSSNPNGYKLAVNGVIGAKEVKVENTSTTWPDYVFNSDYKLSPLIEVEHFIKENKHLPEVPTASEIKEKGQALGEMNALLLKKVEELTLYVIALEKRVSELAENHHSKTRIFHKN